MYKSVILKSEHRVELEKQIEKYANSFRIEHMSFSTIVYPNCDVEYTCCLLFKSINGCKEMR